MLRKRLSLVATAGRGWLAGPLLLIILVAPPIAAQTEESLVIHHLAHWLMVVAGALIGYQLRNLVRLPGKAVIATAGLIAALAWHVPPLLSWAEADRTAHLFAHASLVVGGGAMGWAVPGLSSPARAYLFIATNVVMWPLVLAELAGAFTYTGYPGQASGAGVAELVAMSLSWVVLALWAPLRGFISRPISSVAALALLAVVATAGWVVRPAPWPP